jgi:hypothetical protein
VARPAVIDDRDQLEQNLPLELRLPSGILFVHAAGYCSKTTGQAALPRPRRALSIRDRFRRDGAGFCAFLPREKS